MPCTGLQVPFAPYLLVFFFFVTVTIYLERLKLIKLIKQNKTQTLQWKHTKIAVQMTLGPYWNTFRSALLTIAYWLVVTSGLHCTFVYCTYQKLCRICWKRKTICFCYCLRLTEVCKRRLRINWTTMSQVKCYARKKHCYHRATMFCDKLNSWFGLAFPAFRNGIVAFQKLIIRIK